MENVRHGELVAQTPEGCQALFVKGRSSLEISSDEDDATEGANSSCIELGRQLFGGVDELGQESLSLVWVLRDPERLQREHKTQRKLDVAARGRPFDRGTEIVLLGNRDLEVLAEVGRVGRQVRRLRELEEELGVRGANVFLLA